MATKDDERERWMLEHHMVPDDLESQAVHVRNTYMQFRRQFFPGYCVNKKKHHTKFWWDTARFMIDRKIDVEDFISLCFMTYGSTTRPEYLKSDLAIAKYDKNRQQLYDRAASLLNLYAGNLHRARKNDKHTLEQILTDPRNDFGKLFIWCIAQLQGLSGLAARYHGDAQRLLTNPIYRKVYGKAFPEVF